MGAFTVGLVMNIVMEIWRLRSDGKYRVLAFDPDGYQLQWVSPRYRWLWVARYQGRKDLLAYVRKAYSISATVSDSNLMYVEKRGIYAGK